MLEMQEETGLCPGSTARMALSCQLLISHILCICHNYIITGLDVNLLPYKKN